MGTQTLATVMAWSLHLSSVCHHITLTGKRDTFFWNSTGCRSLLDSKNHDILWHFQHVPLNRVQVFLGSLFSTVSHPSFKLSLCRVSKSVATKLLSKCRLLRGPSCVGYCCLVSLGVVGLACVLYFYFTRNMWPLMAVPRNPQILCPPNRTMST